MATQHVNCKAPVSYSAMVFPLSGKQQKDYDFWVSDSILSVVQRQMDFVMKNTEAFERYQVNMAKGAMVAIVGLGMALLWRGGHLERGHSPAQNQPKVKEEGEKRPSRCIGTGVQFVLSVFAGACLGMVYTAARIERSVVYETWRQNAIQKKIFPIFETFLATLDGMNEFICPITREIIGDPVKDTSGHVYERWAIEKWLTEKTTSPTTNLPLQKDELTYDPTYHVKVVKAIKQRFDQQIEEQVKAGLLAYHTTIMQDRKALLKTICKDLLDKSIDGEITEAEYDAARKACMVHYAIPPLEGQDTSTTQVAT
jgi:hypothetical protein